MYDTKFRCKILISFRNMENIFLQRTIIDDYGETHYNALNHPHLYFQVLALTAQFEAAVEFLTRIERYKVHGVHIAIALHELYMLAGPKDVSSPLGKFYVQKRNSGGP